jgi:hypothetical protein
MREDEWDVDEFSYCYCSSYYNPLHERLTCAYCVGLATINRAKSSGGDGTLLDWSSDCEFFFVFAHTCITIMGISKLFWSRKFQTLHGKEWRWGEVGLHRARELLQ